MYSNIELKAVLITWIIFLTTKVIGAEVPEVIGDRTPTQNYVSNQSHNGTTSLADTYYPLEQHTYSGYTGSSNNDELQTPILLSPSSTKTGNSSLNDASQSSLVETISSSDTPTLSSEDSTSALSSEDSTSALSSEDSTSALSSEDSTSALSSEDSTSALNSTDSTSTLNSTDSTSTLNSTDSTSTLNNTDDSSTTHPPLTSSKIITTFHSTEHGSTFIVTTTTVMWSTPSLSNDKTSKESSSGGGLSDTDKIVVGVVVGVGGAILVGIAIFFYITKKRKPKAQDHSWTFWRKNGKNESDEFLSGELGVRDRNINQGSNF